ARFRDDGVSVVLGPAVGGIIIAYEIARHLGARAVFAERAEGRLTLRRGFRIEPGERCLVVGGVVTTGGSLRGTLAGARGAGGAGGGARGGRLRSAGGGGALGRGGARGASGGRGPGGAERGGRGAVGGLPEGAPAVSFSGRGAAGALAHLVQELGALVGVPQ